MPVQFLTWDSTFFKKRIYKLELSENADPEIIAAEIESIRISSADLAYIFVRNPEQIAIVEKYTNSLLVDKKVTYGKSLNSDNVLTSSNQSNEYTGNATNELLKLAFDAGAYSRFKVDKKLQPLFKKLYTTWVGNSLNRKIADKVFVHFDNSNIIAFVTTKIVESAGIIGLIAVNNEYKGKGLGKSLMAKTEHFYYANNITQAYVATQSDNREACLFYEKCGYSVSKTEYIFHYWIK